MDLLKKNAVSPNIGSKRYEGSLEAIGYDIAGPLICCFVDWVLDAARQQGIKRLYFIARDGQVMRRVALVRNATHIDCRYLYLSRYSIDLALISDSFAPVWLKRPVRRSINELCERLLVEPMSYGSLFLSLGFADADWGRVLDESTYLSVLTKFIAPSNELFRSVTAERKRLLVDFLYQEKIGNDEPIGFVDAGWGATTQLRVVELLGMRGRAVQPVHGYYMGLNQFVQNATGWLYNRSDLSHWLYPYSAVVEQLLLADHGSVVTYKRCDTGKIVPVCSEKVRHDIATVTMLHSGINARALANRLENRNDCIKALRRFIGAPTRLEVRALEQIVLSELGFIEQGVSLVQTITIRKLLKIMRNNHRWVAFCPWPQAAVVHSFESGAIRLFWLRALRLGEELGRLRAWFHFRDAGANRDFITLTCGKREAEMRKNDGSVWVGRWIADESDSAPF